MATENIQHLTQYLFPAISCLALYCSVCTQSCCEFLLWSFSTSPHFCAWISFVNFHIYSLLELSRLISFLLQMAKASVSSPSKREMTPYYNYVQVYIFIQRFPSLTQEGWQAKTLLFDPRRTWKSNCVLKKLNLWASFMIRWPSATWPHLVPLLC